MTEQITANIFQILKLKKKKNVFRPKIITREKMPTIGFISM